MDFFDMNFSTLFLDKHGKEIFEKISKQITQEKIDICDNNYIEIVFKIAFLDFFGLKDWQIKKMIEDFMKCQNVNIEKIKTIHKNSITEIQKYLQSAMDETIKM